MGGDNRSNRKFTQSGQSTGTPDHLCRHNLAENDRNRSFGGWHNRAHGAGDRYFHNSGVQVQGGGLSDHQFSYATLNAFHAGIGILRFAPDA